MSEELKPCPFCGGKAKVEILGVWENGDTGYNVNCRNKGCPVMPDTKCFLSAEKAIAAWNTRADRTCKMEQVAWPGDSATLYVCSECGGWTYTEDEPRYCSMCGAKVVEE